MDDNASKIREAIAYSTAFREALEVIAEKALGVSSLLAAAIPLSLYSPSETVAAMEAAQETGLDPIDGAAALVLLTGMAAAQAKQRTIWGRITSKIPPKEGSTEYFHIKMCELAARILDRVDPATRGRFNDNYISLLERK